jgi:Na+/phosphate symporter
VIILVSLLVALVGVLMYALSVNPKLQEIGRISFAFGLLVFLLRLNPEMVNIFGQHVQ